MLDIALRVVVKISDNDRVPHAVLLGWQLIITIVMGRAKGTW